MNKISFYSVFIFISLISLIACKTNRYDVDISNIKADVRIKRLERDLFTINPDEIPALVPFLKEKYGNFLQLFSYVINTGDIRDSSFSDFLIRFSTDKLNNEVYDLTATIFPDMTGTEESLSKAFRYYKYYFPEKSIPDVFTCISGFNNSIITGDQIIGICLDRYLGADCVYYPRLGIYKYLSDRMESSYIVSDCIFAWGLTEWSYQGAAYSSDNVMTQILHEGKLKYYQKCMLPDVPDEILFGFSSDQMKFCKNNEDRMWQYLLEHNLLFSTDQLVIRKLTGEAPFTAFFTNESPGKAAVWIGFRIIDSYMSKNPETGLEELMKDTNIQTILEKAKYSPK